jgi:muramidase (phage lysozyme)
MKARKLFTGLFRKAVGRAASGRALAATNSRSRRKPEREWRGSLKWLAFALALGACLPLSQAGARAVRAKTKDRTEAIAARYSIDKSPAESDGAEIQRKLLKLLSRPDIRLFLYVIKRAEGGAPGLMVGGCRARSLKQHPALTLPKTCRYRVPGWGFSTASGNYQITYSNWKELAPFLGLRDFSETSQALAALELIRRGGGAAKASTPKGLAVKQRIQKGFVELLRGNVKSALCLATYDWASSTCSPLPASFKLSYAKLADAAAPRGKGPTRR